MTPYPAESALDDGLRFADHRWVAHAVVAREGLLLVLRRRMGRHLGGQWDIPGGTVEAGESPREAARRETAEEAGLTVRLVDELAHLTNADTGGRPICFHTVTYRAQEELAAGDDPVVLRPEEHEEYRWVTLQQALGLNLVWHVRRTVLALGGEGASDIGGAAVSATP